MSESTYRWFSAIAGAVAGAVCVVGFVGLVYRRVTNVRVRRTTSRTDLLVYLLLVILIGLGCWMTFAHNLLTDVAVRLPRLDVAVVALAVHPAARRRRRARAPTPSTRCTRSSPGRSGRCSRSAASCTPGASRCSTSAARTSSTAAATPAARAMNEPPRRGRQLALATLAFTRLLLRLEPARAARARTCRTPLGLSDVQTSVMVAVPVLLGSLMRIPLGWLTDRHGGRVVFTALMAYTPLPLIALALWHDSLGAMLAVRVPARLRRRVVRRRRPVRERLVRRRSARASRSASTAWGWAARCSRASPRRSIADHWGLSAPFWIAAGLVAATAAVFWRSARDAPRGRPPAAGARACSPRCRCSAPAGARGR